MYFILQGLFNIIPPAPPFCKLYLYTVSIKFTVSKQINVNVKYIKIFVFVRKKLWEEKYTVGLDTFFSFFFFFVLTKVQRTLNVKTVGKKRQSYETKPDGHNLFFFNVRIILKIGLEYEFPIV